MVLNLDQLLDEKKPVYVRNVYKPRGIIVFTLVSAAGKTTNGVVPKTRHPVCLNDQANPDTIRHSDHLRRLLSSGALQLIDPEQAQRELSDPEVVEDIKAAWDALSNRKRTTEDLDKNASVALPMTVTHNNMIEEIQKKLNSANIKNIEVAKEPVQSRVHMLIASLKEKQMKPREVRRELQDLDLTKEDLVYIISNTVTGIVNQYAKGQLAKIDPKSHVTSLTDGDEEFVDDGLKVSLHV